MSAVLLAAGMASGPAARAVDPGLPTLTNFPQILALGLTGAQEAAHPVRVRGVVAFPSRGARELLHLYDGTNGVGVNLLGLPGLSAALFPPPKVGDFVEVTGETAAGASHPYIVRATARILGQGQFPDPLSIRARDVMAGRHHGAMVRLRATVLDVSRVRGGGSYLLNADGYGFYATVGEPMDHLPVELLNASLELEGMPWTQFDSAGRPTGFRLLVGSNAWVRVLKPGSSNLFAGARMTLAGVSNAPPSDERFVVSGVVTYAWPNHFFALEDATGAVLCYPLQPIPKTGREADFVARPPRPAMRPGDHVEAVAAKYNRRAFVPTLNDAEYRVVRHERLAPPPRVTEAEALTGTHDCRRVRMQGRVLDRDTYEQFGAKVSRLLVKCGELTSYALLAGSNYVEFPAATGSRVELTGLCVVSAGTERRVRNYVVYLDSPDDVRPLAEPPLWWSAAGRRAAGTAGGALALAFGWVWLLRRQVTRQTAALRASNENLQAEARERSRAEADRAVRMKLLALNADVALALNESAELRPMLQRCAEMLVNRLEAAFARVWLLNDATRTLELEASAGLYTHLDGPHSRVPVGQFKIGLIAQEKQPHLTNDVTNDPRVSDKDWARREGMVAFAGYPLLLEGRALGVVAVFARRPLGEDTMQALGVVANSLALGIERKRAEAGLRVALARERELGELKTRFVSMVSHEFRTPLEVIVSSADILDRYLARLPEAERAEHLAAIQHSVKRMSGMMEDVLLLGRFESERQKFSPDDLHLTAFCRRLTDEMRSATGGKCPIELALDDTLPLAHADEKLLRHILTNLLSNAAKYSPAGVPVRLSLARDRGDAVFRIEDSGLGIPVADQAHLFEAFHRAGNTGQIPGTGLGLVIVKRSVDLHGGQIEFTSEEGKGTIFTVRLPVFAPHEP